MSAPQNLRTPPSRSRDGSHKSSRAIVVAAVLLMSAISIGFTISGVGTASGQRTPPVSSVGTGNVLPLRPAAATYDSANGNLYVASGPDDVYVVSGATNTVIGSPIGVGSYPSSIAYDPFNGDVYVANYLSNNVTVIDGSSNSVAVPGIAVGGAMTDPTDIAVAANGNVYVTEMDNASLTVINGSTNSVSQIYLPEAHPYRVVYDPANLDLYVVESLALHAEDLRNWDPIQGYWIAVVSTVTNRIVATYSTAFPVMGEAYDSDNGYLYVSDFLNSSVCLLDPSDGAIVAQVEIGVQAFDLTYDSANGYVYAIAGTVGNHFEDDNAQIAISAGLGYSAPTSATDVVAVIDGVTVIGPDIPTGGGPSRGVFDSGNQQVYIVNSATGNLTVIDGAPAGATFGGITTGSSADALAFDPTNGEIYEADVSSNCITAVSSGSGAVVDSCIGVGSGPDAIAYDPSNGFLYVANGNSNDLTVIDGSTNLVVTSSIATGTAPSSIVYDSENGYIYVANSGDGTLTVVSTASSVAVATINLDDWPAALAFDSSNGYVYATEPSNDAVAVVDGALNTQVGDIWMNNGCCGGHFYRIPNQPTGITYDPLNGELYVTDYGTGLVAILNTTTNSDTVDLEVGYLPLGITFDPNNGYLYVANEGSGDVSVINGSADSVPVPDLGISFGGSFTLVYDSIHGYLVAGSGSTLVGLDVN